MPGIDNTNPGEIRVRQTPPSGYDHYARKDIGDGISLVLGIKGGKSETQALRFTKPKWDVEKVKTWISAHSQYHMAEAEDPAPETDENENQEIYGQGFKRHKKVF